MNINLRGMKLSLIRGKHDQKDVKSGNPEPGQVADRSPEQEMGEIVSVIGLALSMYMQEMHDYEKAVITMQKVMRPYSPWSSKIYGLRERPAHTPRSRR